MTNSAVYPMLRPLKRTRPDRGTSRPTPPQARVTLRLVSWPGRLALALLLSLTTAFSLPTFAQRTGARGISRTEFRGWSDALELDARQGLPRAIVVPSIGGRLMAYGVGEQNILWVNPETTGRTLDASETGFQPGGFQCDVGPEVAGWPDHPRLSVGPWEASPRKGHLITLRGPEDKNLDVELEKEIVMDPTTGDLGFVHRLKNASSRDAAYCLWHRIACRPGGFVLLPVNPKSRFPAGWSLRHENTGRATYDGTTPQSPAVQVLDGILVAKTGGPATKLGTDSLAQWVAYALDRMLLVVHFPAYSSAIYSEGGNSVTIAWNETMTELQPLSPEARLRSRKSYEFPSKWTLIDLEAPVTTHEQARALASKVPGSPFQ